MGGEEAPNTIDEATLGLINLAKNATKADSGTFREHNGEHCPW